MRTIETTLYTVKELKELHPAAFQKALEKWERYVDQDPAWMNELFDSLMGTFAAAGVKVNDYQLSTYGYHNFVRITMSSEFDYQVGNLTGRRAMAWLENNLLGKLRISWTAKRNENRKYNAAYRSCGNYRPYEPGLVPPAPFTGYCADDDFLNSLKKDLRNGVSLYHAFKNLARVYADLAETEIQNQKSEEYFLDHAEANGYEFNEEGAQQ